MGSSSRCCAPRCDRIRASSAQSSWLATGDHQYTAGELKLLTAIAMQTAPAIEIAHLHQVELEHVRMERDLQVARQVQSGLLPRSLPEIPGWQVAALWQPAQAVGGDFYDFIRFPDGRLGLVIADVANKGVPAALVMANTRSILPRRGCQRPA